MAFSILKGTVSDSNRSGSSTQSNNSLNSSINSNGSSSTASSPRQVNLIKLEVINSSKDRNKTNDSKSKSNTVWNSLSKESASSRETNKPPLPPGSQSTAAAVNTGAAANIIPPGLAPNAWRSKLKSVSHSQSQSHNSSLSDHSESSDPPSKSSDHTRAPSKSRIIPIEIKNSSSKLNHSKSSTGSCYSSNSNTSSSVHRSLSSAASSSLASNKSEKNNTSSTNSSTSQSKVRHLSFYSGPRYYKKTVCANNESKLPFLNLVLTKILCIIFYFVYKLSQRRVLFRKECQNCGFCFYTRVGPK